MAVHLPLDVQPVPVDGGLLVEAVDELGKELLALSHPEGWVHVCSAIPLGAIGPKLAALAGYNLDALLLGGDVHGGVQHAHDLVVARQPQRVLEVVQVSGT
jgi:hypothetical protein